MATIIKQGRTTGPGSVSIVRTADPKNLDKIKIVNQKNLEKIFTQLKQN